MNAPRSINDQCSDCGFVGELEDMGDNDGWVEARCPECAAATYLTKAD